MRILFVGLPQSIHTARWLNQLNGRGWDVHLFPVAAVDEVGINRELRETTVHQVLYKESDSHESVRVVDDFWPFLRRSWPLRRGAYRVRRLLQRFCPAWRDRAWHLAETIRKLAPDVVHSLGIQHAGYLMLEAKKFLNGTCPPWIVSSWGSDIHLFGRLSEHVAKVRGVLAECDYLWCDCERDLPLAAAFGFKGVRLPVLPGAGGFDIGRTRRLQQPGPTSSRQLIVLKGYQNWAGRALVGLHAIERSADLLKGYRVAVYSANADVRIAAELAAQSADVPIDTVPPCSHREMLSLHGRARVSLGLSISDGLPTSMLEAMIMGSFPIQSRSSGASDVITSGVNGILVDPEDPRDVADALQLALSDDELVDRAAKINDQIAEKRLDRSVIEPQVIAVYARLGTQQSPAVFSEAGAEAARS